MIHVMLACSLGVMVLVGALWVVERNRLAGTPSEPAGPAADDLRAPARAASTALPEPSGPESAGDSLCVQCDQAPACPLTFPDCLRSTSSGGGSRLAGPAE